MKQERKNRIHIEFGSDIDSLANDKFIKKRVNNEWLDNSYFFRSGRDCLKYIAKIQRNNSSRVFIPYPCCDSMVMPFKLYNYEIIYYPLNSDYTISFEYLKNKVNSNDILLVENYLGLKNDKQLNQEEEELAELKKAKKIVIIQDYTQSLEQSLYTKKDVYDYYVFSCRKWASLPDGGVLWCKKEIPIIYDQYSSRYYDMRKTALDLKSDYLKNKDDNLKKVFLKKLKEAEAFLENDKSIIEISEYSKNLIRYIDFESILSIRKRNVAYFEKCFSEKVATNGSFKLLSLNSNCSGQYFPIYVDQQQELQKYLVKEKIYCPILWPSPFEKDTKNFIFGNDLICHMLAIPCDQRYNLIEVKHIVKKIIEFYSKKNK